MNLEVLDVLMLFTIVQLFAFAFILFLKQRQTKKAHTFLILFFLALALNVLNLLLFKNQWHLKGGWIHLLYLGSAFSFFYPPSFYLYINTLTHPKKKNKISFYLRHYIPFGMFLVFVLFRYTFLSYEKKLVFIEESLLLTGVAFYLVEFFSHLQVFLYLILIVKEIRQYRKQVYSVLSSDEKNNLSWIATIMVPLLFLWLMDLTRMFGQIFDDNLRIISEIVLFGIMTAFCYYFMYKALQPLPELQGLEQGLRKHSLSDQSRRYYSDKLEKFMKTEKPHLDPGLTLNLLSEKTSIPQRSLSEVINICQNQNFYDFINSYRIKEAEAVFMSDTKGEKNILEILYEVGFNSKSAFNKAFKKKHGLTPTEYRRKYRNG